MRLFKLFKKSWRPAVGQLCILSEQCSSFLAVVSDEVPLVASRQLLQQFAVSLPLLQPEVHKLVAKHALTKIQPRVVSFEEQVNKMFSQGFAISTQSNLPT
jgi:hypothetical protein